MKGTYKGWVFVFQAGFITLFPRWSFFCSLSSLMDTNGQEIFEKDLFLLEF